VTTPHRTTFALHSSTADANAEYVKEQLRIKEAQYQKEKNEKLQQQLRSSGDADLSSVPPLSSIPLVDYIDPASGEIPKIEISKDVRASVYAISDQSKTVRYVGVSRNVAQSLRLHLARMPEEVRVIYESSAKRCSLLVASLLVIAPLAANPPSSDVPLPMSPHHKGVANIAAADSDRMDKIERRC